VGVGVGLAVALGDGVLNDSLGEGDGVVVATGAEPHDTPMATTSASGMRGVRIPTTIFDRERVGEHGVGDHIRSVTARTHGRLPRP
jgi:hypothetical protein